MRRPIIAIDFDGTIVENAYPKIGKLRKGAAQAINSIASWAKIVIWTCRYLPSDLETMKNFLVYHGITFDGVNENTGTVDFRPSPKIFYDVLVDDRNLGGVPEWDEVLVQLEEFRKGWKG